MIKKRGGKVNSKENSPMENFYKKKEGIVAMITVALFLTAVFLTGYFVGKSENRIPIIIEKCSETEKP